MDGSQLNDNKTSGETDGGNLLQAVNFAIGKIEQQLRESAVEKGSLTDLVRLLQLRKELEADQPRHVSARWIEECEFSTDS